MKLFEYIEELKRMANENSKILNYNVVFAGDDEGNNFDEVNYTPTIGVFTDEGEFFTSGDFEDEDLGMDEADINAICIN